LPEVPEEAGAAAAAVLPGALIRRLFLLTNHTPDGPDARTGFQSMISPDAAALAAQLTLTGFRAFKTEFALITLRAEQRFMQRDWNAGRQDAIARMDAYDLTLGLLHMQLEFALGGLASDESLWIEAKARFSELIAGDRETDRAETFFNSVTRKMLHTIGINRNVEFFDPDPVPKADPDPPSIYRTYTPKDDTTAIVRKILEDCPFSDRYEDIARDCEAIAREIDLRLWPHLSDGQRFSIDVLSAAFYRNKAAYVVGRINVASQRIPIIIPLSNGGAGVFADAVLLEEAEAGILFSFAFTYFFVDIEHSDALIGFLHSIIPHAEVAELYTTLGYHRHGKTLFYRSLHQYIHHSREEFVVAPGLEGAVMLAFTLPNFPFVFKVIKDRPCFLRSKLDTPKSVTQDRVRYQYEFVLHRDRAGRMVDTQEFENIRFKSIRFSGQVLNEFALAATKNVSVIGEDVVLHHVYVQRKVVPLPLYFRQEKRPEAIRDVLLDFGYFLKDIAASGVFPCDLFNIWNYGVTPWGRVVLFDYDDVLPIEHVRFRTKPVPRDDIEEFEPEEDWIVASDEDFFLDEMDRFSGIPKPLKGVFNAVHGDLYTLEFWNTLLSNLQNEQWYDFVPFDQRKLFHARHRLT
jgi:isocitrate dehydrogenase kinase/phosphatase